MISSGLSLMLALLLCAGLAVRATPPPGFVEVNSAAALSSAISNGSAQVWLPGGAVLERAACARDVGLGGGRRRRRVPQRIIAHCEGHLKQLSKRGHLRRTAVGVGPSLQRALGGGGARARRLELAVELGAGGVGGGELRRELGDAGLQRAGRRRHRRRRRRRMR